MGEAAASTAAGVGVGAGLQATAPGAGPLATVIQGPEAAPGIFEIFVGTLVRDYILDTGIVDLNVLSCDPEFVRRFLIASQSGDHLERAVCKVKKGEVEY